MGYYTDFDIKLSGDSVTESKAEEIMHRIEEMSGYGFYVTGDYNLKGDCEFKWYDHEEHMKNLALEYPNICFEVIGEGEEDGDLWVKFFKGELYQRNRATVHLGKPPRWAN